MTFEESHQEIPRTSSQNLDMWDDMAFVICSKNTNDMNDLMHRVSHFKHRVLTAP